MNLGNIWQKAKDLYGWDQSQLYYMKDRRAFNKGMAEIFKQRMDKAKDMKQFNKAKFMFEQYQTEFDKADCYVRSNETNSTEEGWRDK
jgi:hypothetical protein